MWTTRHGRYTARIRRTQRSHTCVVAETLNAGCERLLGTSGCPHASSPIFDDPTWGADGEGWTYMGQIPTPNGTSLTMMFAVNERVSISEGYVWVYYDEHGDIVLLRAYPEMGWCCNGDGGSRRALWGDLPAYGMCDPT